MVTLMSSPLLSAAEHLSQSFSSLEGLNTSDTLLINEQSRSLEASGAQVFKLGFGQSPFPVYEPAVRQLAERASSKAYLPVQGLPELRAQVAQFHQKLDQVEWAQERVIIGPGSKLLLFALLSALPPETEVIIPSPAWVSYAPQARLAARQVHRLSAHFEGRWYPSAEALDHWCRQTGPRPRLYIHNAPNNPTGLSLSHTEQAELASVARKHGVMILADEIYGPLHHKGAHRPFALDYPEGTITSSGLSKWCGAGGWRLGVMHVPHALGERLFQGLIGFASETWSSVTSPIQEAACVAYTWSDELEEYLNHQRAWLAEIGLRYSDTLRSAEVRVHPPEGGFYLLPDFERHRERLATKGIYSSADLTARLLSEAGVALLPGSAFGCPADQLCARLAYVDFDGADLPLRPPEGDQDPLLTLRQLRRLGEGREALMSWLARL